MYERKCASEVGYEGWLRKLHKIRDNPLFCHVLTMAK